MLLSSRLYLQQPLYNLLEIQCTFIFTVQIAYGHIYYVHDNMTVIFLAHVRYIYADKGFYLKLYLVLSYLVCPLV